jgi:tRNA nucleotidyltransferase (CCA-adding enzyme)
MENPGINRDMVLLKAFLRRLGIYGAEVAVKGFSGYLSELLIAKHGSLLKLFREVSRWRPPVLIDIEGYYNNNRADAFVMFREPLIVVDPVDKGRNVASAVSKRSLSLFISAVKAFLRKPDIEFFNLSNPRHSYYEFSVWKDKPLVGIMVRHFEEVPDILHSQLERVAKKILKALKGYGIECYRWEVFSNYSDKSVIIMNLSGLRASLHYVRQGPYPYMDGEWRFIRKNRDELIWIDRDGRWKIIERRDKIDVKDIIHQALDMINMPTSLNREGVQITVHVDDELKNLDEPEVRKWIENFYLRREFWVDYV